MKQIIRTYMHTLSLFIVPFVFISLILAILSYFIQLNSLLIQIIIQVIAYASLFIAGLYFTSHLEKNRFFHCLFFSIIYFLVSLLIHLGNLNIHHLFFKSFIFIFICLFKEVRDRKLN